MPRPKQNPPTPTEMRLQAICERESLPDIEALARAIGREAGTVRKWGQRDSIPKDGARAIADHFNLNLHWVLTGYGQMGGALDLIREQTRKVIQEMDAPKQHLWDGMVDVGGTEFVSIPRFDAALSAGVGCILEDHPQPLGYQLIEAQWLRAVTRASPASLAVLQVDGDSMEATLMNDDWVLVDRTQTKLSHTGIYALRVMDTAWVKRIELDLETKLVQLISDNQRYPIRRLPEEELQVLGRVIWVVGRRV